MIRSLYLSNFKAFADTEGRPIPIRPITLIFGPNSAGKSSLIHSLLLAHEGLNAGKLDVQHTKIGGRSVDLGGFRQYVHKHRTSEPVHWGGLSGCTYSEGVSWGKFVPPSEGGRFAEVYADATTVWPLLMKGVLEELGPS